MSAVSYVSERRLLVQAAFVFCTGQSFHARPLQRCGTRATDASHTFEHECDHLRGNV